MPIPFIGRTQELSLLKSALAKKNATLAVVKGRRRIGKSRLIEEVGNSCTLLHFAGLAPTKKISAQTQRDAIAQQMGEQFNLKGLHFTDWADIFTFIDKFIPHKPFILFFR